MSITKETPWIEESKVANNLVSQMLEIEGNTCVISESAFEKALHPVFG